MLADLETKKALENGITTVDCLQMVRDARKKGLHIPVILMGYYNPVLSYGEERMIKDAGEAGVNGFIVVDLPPEEAVKFRNYCTKGGYKHTIDQYSADPC
jgi:tryptophan synthase